VDAIDGFANILGCAKRERDMDAADHKNAVFVFDFASGVCSQPPIACVDFAHFQRAPEGSQHSPGGCSNDVIDGSGVGLSQLAFIDAVVLGDLIMDAEGYRLLFAR
jgi:hypothetical protein